MGAGNINWVVIVVLVTLIAYALRGIHEGFIRTVFGMFSFIIALGAAAILGPDLSKEFQSNEKVLAFVIVFLVAFIILHFLCRTLDIISKLPVLNAFNKLAGLLAGIARGFITIWMWCIVLLIFSTSPLGQNIFLCINENEFLQAIYNSNLIYKIIIG